MIEEVIDPATLAEPVAYDQRGERVVTSLRWTAGCDPRFDLRPLTSRRVVRIRRSLRLLRGAPAFAQVRARGVRPLPVLRL